MLTGKQFKLERDTPGIETVDGVPKQITLPAGAVIRVISGPKAGDGLVQVHWGSRRIELFAVDVETCGIEIRIN